MRACDALPQRAFDQRSNSQLWRWRRITVVRIETSRLRRWQRCGRVKTLKSFGNYGGRWMVWFDAMLFLAAVGAAPAGGAGGTVELRLRLARRLRQGRARSLIAWRARQSLGSAQGAAFEDGVAAKFVSDCVGG